jgi:hypothetical protein
MFIAHNLKPLDITRFYWTHKEIAESKTDKDLYWL